MKKKIYTISSAPTGRIWRDPTEPLVEPTIEIPEQYQYLLTDEEKRKTSNEDLMKILEKYNINTPQYFEHKSNKAENYITGDTFNFPIEILEEYPEYLAGWQTIITNTGLVCFYDFSKTENNFVIYDMFDDDVTPDGPDTDSSFLSDIKPDISMLKMYNMFDQPLNVRKINFTANEFTPERSYVYGNYYAFFNADGVPGSQGLDPQNFFFIFRSKPENFNMIQFNYKPLFVFKIYNIDGSKKDNANIKIDGISAVRDSKGIYFIDLSARDSKDLVSISLQDCGSGYLEVI